MAMAEGVTTQVLADDRLVDDTWPVLPDEAPLPAEAQVLVPFARFLRMLEEGLVLPVGAGLQVPGETDADMLAPHLYQASMVSVVFPRFRDGRGFSLARELRERHGYQGPLRAEGGLIPDQWAFLRRVGFTAVKLPAGHLVETWKAAAQRITIAYQTAIHDGGPVSLLRRHAG